MEVETEVPHAHSLGRTFLSPVQPGFVRRACVRTCVRARVSLYVGDVTKSSLAANAFAEGDPWKRGREGGGASAVSMEREESMDEITPTSPSVRPRRRWRNDAMIDAEERRTLAASIWPAESANFCADHFGAQVRP